MDSAEREIISQMTNEKDEISWIVSELLLRNPPHCSMDVHLFGLLLFELRNETVLFQPYKCGISHCFEIETAW
jgi:hypothetical protein